MSPRAAVAWCRTTTFSDFVPTPKKTCDDTGLPLFWSSKCLGYSVQRNGSVQVDLATARTVAQAAFDEWDNADCPLDPIVCAGGGHGKPSIVVRDEGPVNCDRVEYNDKVGNANIIMFRDQDWPHPDQDSSTLALTTVTFSTVSGEIYDVDMEINSNPSKNQLTTSTTGRVVYDFYSILTHETGHFLGLAHTQPQNTAAAMYFEYKQGKTFMRHLSQDDRCAICATYPPKRETFCDDTPRNGLALECGGVDLAPIKKGCHCASVGRGSREDGNAWIAAMGLGSLTMTIGALRRRRRGLRQ
ncbi:MAG: hypothetical protein NVS3B20_11420 [Polyangiales bacterium]